MATPVTLTEIRRNADNISAAVNEHLTRINKRHGDKSATLYELFVALSYLNILKSRHLEIKAVNFNGRTVVLPLAPARGCKKFSYFEIWKRGTHKKRIANIFFGLEVLTSNRTSFRAPDITVASPSSKIESLNSRVVRMIIDAKCRNNKTKRITLSEIDSFIRVNEKLRTPKSSISFELSWTNNRIGSCLVTNGISSTEPDLDLIKKKIFEVSQFSPGQQQIVRP